MPFLLCARQTPPDCGRAPRLLAWRRTVELHRCIRSCGLSYSCMADTPSIRDHEVAMGGKRTVRGGAIAPDQVDAVADAIRAKGHQPVVRDRLGQGGAGYDARILHRRKASEVRETDPGIAIPMREPHLSRGCRVAGIPTATPRDTMMGSVKDFCLRGRLGDAETHQCGRNGLVKQGCLTGAIYSTARPGTRTIPGEV